MSNPNSARRATADLVFEGVDITKELWRYILSITYTDNEEDETDDLQIKLQDRNGEWLGQWLGDILSALSTKKEADTAESGGSSGSLKAGDEIIANGQGYYNSYGALPKSINLTNYESTVLATNYGAPYPIAVGWIGWFAESQVKKKGAPDETTSAAKKGFNIQATIRKENWTGGGKDTELDCGTFELDAVTAAGPPNAITLKATSLPYSSKIRQTEQSKAWENCRLSDIAKEMASKNGMECMFLSKKDPYYKRVEQHKTSDIKFLSTLCHNAGISLKATNNSLVLFDQIDYESKDSVLTIKRTSGLYTKYQLNIGQANVQYDSCRVSYTDPDTGQCIEAIAKVEDYDEESENNQQLEITAKVSSTGEASALAEKMLRMHNRYSKTATFTLPGDTGLVAGVTVVLNDFGAWDGKYIVSQAIHTISTSGYTTQIKLRRVLEGY